MDTIKCFVIDDEPLARECIINYSREIDFIDVVGEGSNPMELTKLMNEQQVDLVFLDIQMPVMNGIDYLKTVHNPPKVIFTTAYPSYALEGYELNVLDYLLKPITFTRFFQAASKAKDFFKMQHHGENEVNAGNDAESFFIKCDNKFEKIKMSDVLFVEAMQNYVVVHTTQGKKHITLLSLKSVEQNLNPELFLRVHKSYIVSIPHIDSIENSELHLKDFRIPISRNFKKDVMERILGSKLWNNK